MKNSRILVSLPSICKTYITEHVFFKRALKDILAKTVHPFVHLIARPVEILMDIVAVPLVIQGTDAL